MNAASLTRLDGDSLIGQRRAKSLAQARARSTMIERIKLALGIIIALALLNVLVQIIMAGTGAREEASFAVTGGERIINPRFTGRDEAGQPFVVTATSAMRPDAGVGIAELELPNLQYALINSAQSDNSTVLANAGLFDEYNRTLLLREAVKLTTTSGYALATESALIVLSEGRIEGEDAVRGTGPWGSISANGFEVSRDGQHIELVGDVRTRLYLDATNLAPGEPATGP